MALSFQLGTTPSPTDEVWSVSRLTHMVKRLVEGEMLPLWIRGEVVQFKAWPGSGHWYFNLRDRNCQVRCCMWSRDVPRRATPLKDGTEVFVLGQPVIYEAKGEFQLKVTQIIPTAEIGAAQQELERVRALLQKDGLFDRGAEAPDTEAREHRRRRHQRGRRGAAGHHHRGAQPVALLAGSSW